MFFHLSLFLHIIIASLRIVLSFPHITNLTTAVTTCFNDAIIPPQAPITRTDCTATLNLLKNAEKADRVRRFKMQQMPISWRSPTCVITLGSTANRGWDKFSYDDIAGAAECVLIMCALTTVPLRGGVGTVGDRGVFEVEVAGPAGGGGGGADTSEEEQFTIS